MLKECLFVVVLLGHSMGHHVIIVRLIQVLVILCLLVQLIVQRKGLCRRDGIHLLES